MGRNYRVGNLGFLLRKVAKQLDETRLRQTLEGAAGIMRTISTREGIDQCELVFFVVRRIRVCMRAVVHEGAWFVLLFLWGVTALGLCHDVATAKEITDQLSGIELVNFNSGEVLRCCGWRLWYRFARFEPSP